MRLQDGSVPVVHRPRRRAKTGLTPQKRVPVLPPLPPALESLFGLICEPVLKLETAPDAQTGLHEISILLGDVLDLLEEDRAILRAADELYAALLDLHDARERCATCANITERTIEARGKAIHVQLAAFRASLYAAKPSARARARRIAW